MPKNGIDLIKVLDLTYDNEDINHPFTRQPSLYYDYEGIKKFLRKHRNKITVLSLNIQSINAKLNELTLFLCKLLNDGLLFDVITLQECWLTDEKDLTLLNIPNYTIFAQANGVHLSTHCGLVTYVNNRLSADIFLKYKTSTTWEGLFVDISLSPKSKIAIGNIYKPPGTNIDEFRADFINKITNIKRHNEQLVLAGDFNIDLLLASAPNKYQDFYDSVTNLYMLPTITFPTRFPEKSNEKNPSLIDQIYIKFSNCTNNYESGIYYPRISDHKATFLALNVAPDVEKCPKYVKIKTSNKASLDRIKEELRTVNWTDIFNHDVDANPNETYEKVCDHN